MQDPTSIILIAHSVMLHHGDRSFRVARRVDPLGLRTLVAVTKIDLMDPQYDCKHMLLNKEVYIQYGHIGVVNRCESDFEREKRENFFTKHPVYSQMPQNLFGVKALIAKLTSIQLLRIRPNMQLIVREVRDKLAECEK